MLRLLTKESVFGEMQCYIYSVEWQKRGLPHIHILLWLEDKMKPTDVDSIISAEIPDNNADPYLYDVITTTMLHGPCGPLNPRQVCMKDGQELSTTICSRNSNWPRRIPSVPSVPAAFSRARRQNGFCLQAWSAGHFTADNIAERVQQGPPRTKLTAFFELCKNDSFAATLLYCDVSTYYTWQESSKSFQCRKQGKPADGHAEVFESDVVGTVYTVHPSNAECFYLHLLLHQIHGPTSFADLKTVDGELCETFREACQRRGLLESDAHWFSALEEAASSQLPRQLRQLFAVVISVCAPSNPRSLFEAFREAMADDILLQLR